MAGKSAGKAKTKESGRPAAKLKVAAAAKSAAPSSSSRPSKSKPRTRVAKPASGKPTSARPTSRKAIPRGMAKPKPKAARATARQPRRTAKATAAVLVAPVLGLTEEETIESAKYQMAGAPRRLFEEERFIFPESYGVNRIRLLVKDPDWLFVHWDVAPASLSELRDSVGERTVALSKLTLRIADPGNGGMSVVLLPPGVRSWYVRADSTRRAYRAELGLTLPSGEFRRLAESNTIVTPRVGPSGERARRVMLYQQAQMIPTETAFAVGADEVRSASASSASSGPWSPERERQAPEAPGPGGVWGDEPARQGGASDAFRPGGASDVHRR
jgi:hypothetical protein